MAELKSNPFAHLDMLDMYDLRYLPEHMEASGLVKELHDLLAGETDERRNAWYDIKESASQTTSYLDHIARALRMAEQEYDLSNATSAARSIGLQTRYALITSSVNSLAQSLPPVLLGTVVEKGLWEPSQGVAYAFQVPDLKKRVAALAAVAPYLEESQIRDVMSKVQAVGDEHSRAQILAALAPHLPKPLRRDARTMAGDEWGLARFEDWLERRVTPVILWPLGILFGGFLWLGLLFFSLLLPSRTWRAKTLRRIIGASVAHQDEAITTALATLLPILPSPLKDDLFHVVLDVVQDIPIQWTAMRSPLLKPVARYLPKTLLKDAIRVGYVIQDDARRAEVISHLDNPARNPVVHMTEYELRQERESLEILVQAWGLTRSQFNAQSEKRAGQLERKVAEVETDYDVALKALRGIKEESERARKLATLACELPEYLLPEALETALRLPKYFSADSTIHPRVRALLALIPRLPEPLKKKALSEALKTARGIRYQGSTTGESWQMESQARHSLSRIKSLMAIVPDLSEPLRSEMLMDAEMAVFNVMDQRWRAIMMSVLISHLVDLGYYERAYENARSPWDETYKIWALYILITYISESLQTEIIQEALDTAHKIEHEKERVKALVAVIPHLPDPQKVDVLQEILDIIQVKKRLSRQSFDAPLILTTTSDLYRFNRVELERTTDLADRLMVLAQLGYPREALTVARTIEEEGEREQAIARLASHLAKLSLEQLYPLWIEHLDFMREYSRKDLLLEIGALKPIIAALGGTDAVMKTILAIQDVGRWWP